MEFGMRILTSFAIISALFMADAIAAGATSRGRPGTVQGAMLMSAPTQDRMPSLGVNTCPGPNCPPGAVTPPPVGPGPTLPDMRTEEKNACLANNRGMGNTFVWASRVGGAGEYANMVEDTKNPENNACFVRIELSSSESCFGLSNIAPVYKELGQGITCGSWADEKKLEQTILDCKKKGRVGGTIAGAVGGAVVGVGAMELFGNRLIGGKVMGQKGIEGTELLRSQLLVLKKESPSEFSKFMSDLRKLEEKCDDKIWETQKQPDECNQINYKALLSDPQLKG